MPLTPVADLLAEVPSLVQDVSDKPFNRDKHGWHEVGGYSLINRATREQAEWIAKETGLEIIQVSSTEEASGHRGAIVFIGEEALSQPILIGRGGFGSFRLARGGWHDWWS